MRLVFSPDNLNLLFERLRSKSNLPWGKLADYLKVSQRTLFDWREGKYTIPDILIDQIKKEFEVIIPKPAKILDEFWSKSFAGKLGAKRVRELYGNPGTKEGCKLGALRAMETHRRKGSKFFVPKEICIPKRSNKLAEFIGILLGDGGITKRQVTITLHKFDDKDFGMYTKNLISELFSIEPSIFERESTLNLVISRTKLVNFLVDQGLQIGSKVRHQIDIPEWIKKSVPCIKACVRGLFDTDGCFYIDRHRYKDKIYYNCAMNFSNRSLPILSFFKESLENIGFHPTQNTKFSVSLRREQEIFDYFKKVGSSNPKHKEKFQKYFQEKYGEVPKWS